MEFIKRAVIVILILNGIVFLSIVGYLVFQIRVVHKTNIESPAHHAIFP